MSWQTVISHALAFALGAVFGYGVACWEVRKALRKLDERRKAREAKE